MDVSKSELLKNITVNQKSIKTDTKNTLQKSHDAVHIPIEKEIKSFSVKTLLDSLFKDFNSGVKSQNEVFNTLKRLDVSLNIKDTVADLKILLQLFNSDPSMLKVTKKLEMLLLDIKNMTPDMLKWHLEKSGVFLESKLAKMISVQNIDKLPDPMLAQFKNEIYDDIKTVLLRAQDKLSRSSGPYAKESLSKIDKVLTNIHYFQLLSFSAGAGILYLPLLWKGLEEGRIDIKKLKQNKYFCEVNLQLKQYGKIDLLLMLFDDRYINISFFAENTQLLELLRENLQELKNGITNVGLMTSNFYVFDYLKDDKIKKETRAFAESSQIGGGINLHV